MTNRRTTQDVQPRRSWIALRLARVAVLALGGWALLVFLLQRAVVFPGRFRTAEAPRTPEGVRSLWLETSFGRVEAWLIPGAGDGDAETRQPGIVYFHGNGELIDDWGEPMRRLAANGPAVLAVEFPGYGRSDGRPSRATIRESAAAAWDRLAAEPGVDARRIVAYGRSLGGGAAADLAEDRPATAALILQSTFSSTRAMAGLMYVPGLLVRDRFDPRRVVAGWDGPVLLMHGRDDEVIPYAQAEAIAATRPGLEVTDIPCGHNDCLAAWPGIVDTITRFLEERGILPTPEG